MKIDKHLTRELKNKPRQQKENKVKMNDKIIIREIVLMLENQTNLDFTNRCLFGYIHNKCFEEIWNGIKGNENE